MTFAAWLAASGALLIFTAITRRYAQRVALTTPLLFLGVGFFVGPYGSGVLEIDIYRDSVIIERITEVVVIVSLFSAGLKLGAPITHPVWRAPLCMATLSMVMTIAGIALVSIELFGLSPGAAILLGAILAPTDPVLASDVQIKRPDDQNRVRVGLTAEAGLNDGTAFPFVILGLSLTGLHDLGVVAGQWLVVDVVWAIASGIGIGLLIGYAVGIVVAQMHARYGTNIGFDEFIAFGLIALAYGVAVLAHGYGFLAVFVAALAFRRADNDRPMMGLSGNARRVLVEQTDRLGAKEAETGALTRALLNFNERAEHIGEFVILILAGALILPTYFSLGAFVLAVALFVVIRPLSVLLGLAGFRMPVIEKLLIGWFGIRGIGSVFYLSYALNHGLVGPEAQKIVSVVLACIAISAVVHGLSALPVMTSFRRAGDDP